MTYSAGTPKYIIFMILFSMSFLPNFNRQTQIIITLLAIIIILLQFHFTVTPCKLEYKVNVSKFTIYRQTLSSENIKMIKLSRMDWTTKNAVVKVRGGFNFGVAQFKSEQLVYDLEAFAHTHNIEVKKTRDYLLLEKYYPKN